MWTMQILVTNNKMKFAKENLNLEKEKREKEKEATKKTGAEKEEAEQQDTKNGVIMVQKVHLI